MAATTLANALPTFVELNDLKRVSSAGRTGSIATRLFQQGWAALLGGRPVAEVGAAITARALAAARLGDLDREFLAASDVPERDALSILETAALQVAGPLLDPIRHAILPGLATALPQHDTSPGFVAALVDQPRAGITCPGKPRILLEPPENHGEHCVMVAVYGVLLCPRYAADPDRVFLAALAHHFHNAGMPDSGFTGEVLLGDHLAAIMAQQTARVLEQLPTELRARVVDAREILPDAASPEGQAFHAADVLDRVLQIQQYTRAAALTPAQMLGEMELVHDGPVKPFHDDVLRQAGLLPC